MKQWLEALNSWTSSLFAPFGFETSSEGLDIDQFDMEQMEVLGQQGLLLMGAGLSIKVILILSPLWS